jgi:hypothetical protein
MWGSKQIIGENATALQAQGDIYYQGLSLRDVKMACELFLENNFPRLREIAKQQAVEQVREFAEIFSGEIERSANKIFVERFESPDVQASINDAVGACARKGAEASPHLLSTILVSKMAKDNTKFVDVVLSEAINVVPKLTQDQILFLVLAHSVRSVKPVTSSFAEYEMIGKNILPLIEGLNELSESNILHLQYAGALNYTDFLNGNVREHIQKNMGNGFPALSYEEFCHHFANAAPSYERLIQKFDEFLGIKCVLTSVGMAIAISFLRRKYEDLSFTIWLK